jgi:hypothetical protein
VAIAVLGAAGIAMLMPGRPASRDERSGRPAVEPALAGGAPEEVTG